MRVLLEHDTFSSAVSQHLSVPSGMNQPEHTVYRRIIDPLFFEANAGVRTRLPWHCYETGTGLDRAPEVEFIADAAVPLAVQVQCAFLGRFPQTAFPSRRGAPTGMLGSRLCDAPILHR